jgi:hypothetical protein
LFGVQHKIGDGSLEGRAGSFIAVGMELHGDPRTAPPRNHQFDAITAPSARLMDDDRAAIRVGGGGRVGVAAERLPLEFFGRARLTLGGHQSDQPRPGTGLPAAPGHANGDGPLGQRGFLRIRPRHPAGHQRDHSEQQAAHLTEGSEGPNRL